MSDQNPTSQGQPVTAEMEDLKNNLIMAQVENLALTITAKMDSIDQKIQMQLDQGEKKMNELENLVRMKAEQAELKEHRRSVKEKIKEQNLKVNKIAEETEFFRTLQKRPKLTVFVILVVMSFLITDVRDALGSMLGIRQDPIVTVETLDKKMDQKFDELNARLIKIESANHILEYMKKKETPPCPHPTPTP